MSGVNLRGAKLHNADLSGASLASDIDRDLALSRIHARDLISELTFVLALAPSDRDLSRAVDRAQDLERDLNRAFALNRACDLDFDRVLACVLARDYIPGFGFYGLLVVARSSDGTFVCVSDRIRARASYHYRGLKHNLDRVRHIVSNGNHQKTDFTGANLSGANLSEVDFGDAILDYATLNDAIVANTLFGQGVGLTEEQKRDLQRRGAVFDDAPAKDHPI